MKKYSTSTTIEITIIATVEVDGVYYPEKQGTYYRSNGDPGDPPEAAEFCIDKISWQGMDITRALNNEGYDFASLEDEIVNKLIDQE